MSNSTLEIFFSKFLFGKNSSYSSFRQNLFVFEECEHLVQISRNVKKPEQGAHMFVPHQLLNTTYGPEVLLPCPQQFPHHPGSDDGCERGRELQLRGQHLHFLVFQAANQGCLKTSMSKKVGRLCAH